MRTIYDPLFLRHYDSSVRLMTDRWSVRDQRNLYFNHNSRYVLADLTASHRFTPHIESVLEMQNVGNHYSNDFAASYATIGRQTRAGFRIRL